jgi:hypothetical protein
LGLGPAVAKICKQIHPKKIAWNGEGKGKRIHLILAIISLPSQLKMAVLEPEGDEIVAELQKYYLTREKYLK